MSEKKDLKIDDNEFWSEADIIHTYTRKDAIEDGTLIQVDTKISKEAGLKWPVAIHRSVWEKYVDWTKDDTQRQTYQDLEGRLWDVLYMLRCAIGYAKENSNRLRFELYVIPRGTKSKAKKPRLTCLWALFHPGNDAEPVITILEHEYDE